MSHGNGWTPSKADRTRFDSESKAQARLDEVGATALGMEVIGSDVCRADSATEDRVLYWFVRVTVKRPDGSEFELYAF